MDIAVENVIAELNERDERENKLYFANPEEFNKHIDDYLISIGPVIGQFFHSLIIACGAKTIVEVGASYGYSTLWFADAARATGGKVHSLELSSKKADFSRTQLKRAGVEQYVEFHVGSALDTLPTIPGPFHFVLIDLWKDLYIPSLDLVYPKLATGGLICADNILHPEEFREGGKLYSKYVRSQPGLESVLLDIGAGIEFSVKK